MNEPDKNTQQCKPPKLLRGLFSTILLITSVILASAWFIINYQVEQLVAIRTSEYAHSIAQVAANSSAEALLSKDTEQLAMLVKNVARDPYIRSATVYAEDGQIVVQFPLPHTTPSIEQEKSSSQALTPKAGTQQTPTNNTTSSSQTKTYLQTVNDIPFVEKITFEEVTRGWFKVTLNRKLLESSFRQSLKRSIQVIIVISVILIIILFIVLMRFDGRVKSLVNHNHRLIQINAAKLPHSPQQWLDCIAELSQTKLLPLIDSHSQRQGEVRWITSKRQSNTTFCYCQFAMEEQQNEQTADCLNRAEGYLNSAIQAHGLLLQGNILSGTLIPFFESENKDDALVEALCFIQLLKELLESLPLSITMRAFIGSGMVLTLENERTEITGISLSNRLADKIFKLTPDVQFGETVCLCFEAEELISHGQFQPVKTQAQIPSFKLTETSSSIQQQVARQVSFISLTN